MSYPKLLRFDAISNSFDIRIIDASMLPTLISFSYIFVFSMIRSSNVVILVLVISLLKSLNVSYTILLVKLLSLNELNILK